MLGGYGTAVDVDELWGEGGDDDDDDDMDQQQGYSVVEIDGNEVILID